MQTVLDRTQAPTPVAPEEAARADFYALLAALLHHAPDAKLLRTIALAAPIEGTGDGLAGAWSQLMAASGVVDEEAVAEEFETLFVGVGKSKVSIYAGHYEEAAAAEPARVRIIEDLAALGLAHAPDATEPADHFAGLLDAMRVLVAGGAGRGPATLAQQMRFFEAHVNPGVRKFLMAVREAPESNYYRKVAAVGEAFIGIEVESFNLG